MATETKSLDETPSVVTDPAPVASTPRLHDLAKLVEIQEQMEENEKFLDELQSKFEMLPATTKIIHEKPASRHQCKACKRLYWVHNNPVGTQLVPMEKCWVCSKKEIYGECWCNYCHDYVGSLCRICKNKGPTQCNCVQEIDLKDVPQKKKKETKTRRMTQRTKRKLEEKEKQKQERLAKDKKKKEEETSKKDLQVMIGVERGRFITEEIKFSPSQKQILKEAGLQDAKFVLKCMKETPSVLSEKFRHHLYSQIIGSMKKGKEEGFFFLMKNNNTNPAFFYTSEQPTGVHTGCTEDD